MASEWYYKVNGKEKGPISIDALRSLAATGGIQPTDAIWNEGMPAWSPAFTVAELQFPPPVVTQPTQPLPTFAQVAINTSTKAPIAQSRSDESRYPNLHRYLNWLNLLAAIELAVAIMIAIVMVLRSLFATDSAALQLSGIAISLAIIAAGWLGYVLTLASVELLCVIMDIEYNTRMTATYLDRKTR